MAQKFLCRWNSRKFKAWSFEVARHAADADRRQSIRGESSATSVRPSSGAVVEDVEYAGKRGISKEDLRLCDGGYLRISRT